MAIREGFIPGQPQVKYVYSPLKIGLLALVVIVVLSIVGCNVLNTAEPSAGYEGVLTKKPYFFGHGGIDPEPVRAGREWIAPSTTVTYVSVQPIQAEVDYSNAMTKDGVPVEIDAVIQLQVTDTVRMIRDFGPDWYKFNIEKEFANQLKQQVRVHGMNEIAISSTEVGDVQEKVSENMRAFLTARNMPVRLVGDIIVGRVLPPDSVKNQRIDTATQEQRVKTEGQKKLAEDARAAAEHSRAEADNAYRNTVGLNPEQFIQLETLHAQERICTSGAHCTYILNGSRTQPIIDAH